MEQQILDNDLTLEAENESKRWAGFWIRTGAAIIDGLTYLPFILFNFYNLYSLKNLGLQIIVNVLLLVYKPLMEYKYGATLGKMAVKIKTVNLNFESLTLQQSILRNLPFWLGHLSAIVGAVLLFQNISFITATTMTEVSVLQNQVPSHPIDLTISCFTLISCIVVAFTAKKQGLHDIMANTYCVYRD